MIPTRTSLRLITLLLTGAVLTLSPWLFAQQSDQEPMEAAAPSSADQPDNGQGDDETPGVVVDVGPTSNEPLAGDAEAGASKITTCVACHGQNGNSNSPEWPKLAGQHELYIVRQLQLYKSGEREGVIMAPMAAPLSDQDMHDIGAYYEQQTLQPGVADESLSADAARLYRGGDADRNLPACIACHGPAGRGNPGVPYPVIGGQHGVYTANVLRQFQQGAVWGDNQIMAQIAEHLTDDEITGLASWLEGLHKRPSGTAGPATSQ